MRPEPSALSPAEQAETDRVAARVLSHLRLLLRPGIPVDRQLHEAWAAQQLGLPHSEACDCAECVEGVETT